MDFTADINRLSARSTTCSKLMIGLTVVIVVLTAISVYLTYTDLVNYYKVDFVPIPRYMIDEKDLIGYNSKGEKIVLKNQSAYYKAILCNRTEKDEMYSTLDNVGDQNGDGTDEFAYFSLLEKEDDSNNQHSGSYIRVQLYDRVESNGSYVWSLVDDYRLIMAYDRYLYGYIPAEESVCYIIYDSFILIIFIYP